MNNAKYYLLAALFSVARTATAQQNEIFTHTDSLRGTYSAARSWWDILHYDINVILYPKDSAVSGSNLITYKPLSGGKLLQLDLMTPMIMDSILQDGKKLEWRQDGNAYFIPLTNQKPGELRKLKTWFHGKPRVAKNAPWDGGVVWAKDKNGNTWVSIACQGMAAQVWLPNKDHQADEPDSVTIHITAPRDMVSVSNGRLKGVEQTKDGLTFTWAVSNPINNYNIIPYIGKYQNFRDTFNGKGGRLDLDFWVLEGNIQKARAQFAQVKPMLRCYEEWFGKYPFYEDGYKLVEAPYLGMEHQSGIAYGNNYRNGYQGRDLSNTGWGLKWDFLIIHESGHEWFGNNITAKDVADNWIHESFTAYGENLFTEWLYGKKAGAEYVIGTRTAIKNDKPMIGPYNVNRDGSNDVYWKGANMLHMIRQIVNNDSLWKETLRGLNKTFWHRTVTTKEIEDYMNSSLKISLRKIFDQYLRTTMVPRLEYKTKEARIQYRWANCIKGFDMPVKVTVGDKELWLNPTEKWTKLEETGEFKPDANFYIQFLKID